MDSNVFITSGVRILLISFSVTFIILHFKEVLIHYNTHDANKDRRSADKACEEEKSHVFGIVALYITNEEGYDRSDKHYEVVHDFVFCLLFYLGVITPLFPRELYHLFR